MAELEFPEDYVEKFDANEYFTELKDAVTKVREGYELVDDQHGSSVTGTVPARVAAAIAERLGEPEGGRPVFIDYTGSNERVLERYRRFRRSSSAPCLCVTRGGSLRKVADMHDDPVIRLPTVAYESASLFHILGVVLALYGVDIEGIGDVRLADAERHGVELSDNFEDKFALIVTGSELVPIGIWWEYLCNTHGWLFASQFTPDDCVQSLGVRGEPDAFHGVFLTSKDGDATAIQTVAERFERFHVSKTRLNFGGFGVAQYVSALLLGCYTAGYSALRREYDPLDTDEQGKNI